MLQDIPLDRAAADGASERAAISGALVFGVARGFVYQGTGVLARLDPGLERTLDLDWMRLGEGDWAVLALPFEHQGRRRRLLAAARHALDFRLRDGFVGAAVAFDGDDWPDDAGDTLDRLLNRLEASCVDAATRVFSAEGAREALPAFAFDVDRGGAARAIGAKPLTIRLPDAWRRLGLLDGLAKRLATNGGARGFAVSSRPGLSYGLILDEDDLASLAEPTDGFSA
jgi:hypothetical protein